MHLLIRQRKIDPRTLDANGLYDGQIRMGGCLRTTHPSTPQLAETAIASLPIIPISCLTTRGD